MNPLLNRWATPLVSGVGNQALRYRVTVRNETLGVWIIEADGVTELYFELLGEPRRDRLRRDPARLRVADHARDAAARLETDLR